MMRYLFLCSVLYSLVLLSRWVGTKNPYKQWWRKILLIKTIDIKHWSIFEFVFHPYVVGLIPNAAWYYDNLFFLCFDWDQQGTVLESSGSQASFLKQSLTLTRRSFVNMRRDIGYYWLRLAIYITLSLCLGSIYFKLDKSYGSILVWILALWPWQWAS